VEWQIKELSNHILIICKFSPREHNSNTENIFFLKKEKVVFTDSVNAELTVQRIEYELYQQEMRIYFYPEGVIN